MDFEKYQAAVKSTDQTKREQISILGLVGEVGSVVGTIKKHIFLRRKYPSFRAELAEELGDALWYISSVASKYELSLDQIAQKNIRKTQSLHSQGTISRFDKAFPSDERLPRKFVVEFHEVSGGSNPKVKLRINNVFIGDPLTDNSYYSDDYRYHDVFHLGYAAVLGWSPVVRAQLKRKRKSKQKVDEVEDGGRAQVVEEALSIYIFNYAKRHNFFEGISGIEFGLLKTIRSFVDELEVRKCTAKQWEKAILLGYTVFRELRANRGGVVTVDLEQQRLEYKPHAEPARRNRKRQLVRRRLARRA